ncbi:alpha/beta fold hydrolase [Flavobacterium sp.]|uniref:alpha/beta fold hydrolase n=1 Tax=Flavobacterium sp. TaxID=239 RepID=UPI003F696D37
MSKKSKKSKQGVEIPKFILFTAKFLEISSTKLVLKFVAKLFTTPIKYKSPKREFNMENNSQQEMLLIPKIKKRINVYHYGTGDKKILLVHGWSGRGTQMFKIADAFLEKNYGIISFDAPAHGKSESKTSLMPEFIESILELDSKFGPFEMAIGHSLGGISILNATKKGFKTQKIVTIGSADKTADIVKDFIAQLQLKASLESKLIGHFENKLNEKMSDYDSHHVIKDLKTPLLIIHDNDDVEVQRFCADNIHKHALNSELFITNELGHRKIVGSDVVVDKIIEFSNRI